MFGILILIYAVVPLGMRPLLLSGFDGVWVRQGASANAPDEMRIHLTRRGEQLRMEIPVSLQCASSNESVLLQLDGKEHPVSGDSQDCSGLLMDSAGYSALRSKDSVVMQWDLGENRPTLTETWSLSNHGRTMTWSGAGRNAVYRKASWFRDLFSAEP